MTTDAELNAEEKKLRARVARAEAAMKLASNRIREIEQERLILHKAEHQAAYGVARTDARAKLQALKDLMLVSDDPKAITTAARETSSASQTMSNTFYKAIAGEGSRWDNPANQAMENLSSEIYEYSEAAETLAEYLYAAGREQDGSARKKLFLDTARGFRRGGNPREEGGLPCTSCGEPKWGYNDEGYECRNCY